MPKPGKYSGIVLQIVRTAIWEETEQSRATRLNGITQTIAGLPPFEGESANLEFFHRKMDLLADQTVRQPFDNTTAN